MAVSEFSLKALYEAIDAQRRARGLSWAAAALEINRGSAEGHPIAVSTIRGLATKSVGEGDGILGMLLWLGRSPESFIPGFPDANAERYHLPQVARHEVLRWDAKAIHAALNAERRARGWTWAQVAAELGRCTPGMLAHLSKGGRVGFPGVMRFVRWLDEPAAKFVSTSIHRLPVAERALVGVTRPR
jgi:hypothetical protein